MLHSLTRVIENENHPHSELIYLPTPEVYQTYVSQVDKTSVDTYRYLNFNQLSQ